MRFIMPDYSILFISCCWWSSLLLTQDYPQHHAMAFTTSTSGCRPSSSVYRSSSPTSQLQVSIGLGPDKKLEEDGEEGTTTEQVAAEKRELVPGVDYEIPDHEAFRTSRRSKLDEQCDEWFGSLLGGEDDKGIMGSLADGARKTLLTPVPLINEVCFCLFESI
jgi:hypothetical protein